MRVLFSIGLALALAGCGNGSAPPGNPDFAIDLGSDDGPAFSQFASDQAQAVCANLMACGRLDAADLARCLEEQAPAPQRFDEQGEIAAGRLTIHESDCLAALQGARCDGEDSGRVAAACGAVLAGHVLPGGACLLDAECAGGFCAHDVDGGTLPVDGCAGTCAAWRGEGAGCDSDVECDPDHYCNLDSSTCAPRATAGHTCSVDTPCQRGLYCGGALISADGNGTCQSPSAPGQAGAACDPQQSIDTSTPTCDAGLFCQVTYDSTLNPTGFACATQLATGAACDPESVLLPSVDSPCVDGQSCFAIGAAASACHPIGRANAPCSIDTDCASGLYCDPVAATCTAKTPTGGGCDPVAQHCNAGSGAGFQACIAGADADSGLGGTCQAPLGYGDSCPTDQPGRCTTGTCSAAGRCEVACQ